MSTISDSILSLWNTSNYSPPSIPVIYSDNEYMAVIEDSGDFIRFMSSDGQIFLTLNQNNNCQLAVPDQIVGTHVYFCEKITPILCSPTAGVNGDRDFFVLNNIVPLLV